MTKKREAKNIPCPAVIQGTAQGLEGAYGECERSQDKKIVMIDVRKGPQEERCGMKRRNEEKSTAQEENHNRILAFERTYHDLHTDL